MNLSRTLVASLILAASAWSMSGQTPPHSAAGEPSTRNSEVSVTQQAMEFFQRFEEANRASDAVAIGRLYAESFLFGGPKGVQAVRNADFVKLVPMMKKRVSELGLSETRLQTVEARALDAKYLLADVRWKMTIGNPSENRHIDASATYVLVRGEEGELTIAMQIDHQDLQVLLRNAGE